MFSFFPYSGDFKKILPSMFFGNVLAFSSKWRRVHSRWFRQCLSSGGLGGRDQDAAEALLEFCELFDPTRPHYRPLWLQQGNGKKMEKRFYPKIKLRLGFAPRLPSQSCPIREIYVWRAKSPKSGTESPATGGLLAGQRPREPR